MILSDQFSKFTGSQRGILKLSPTITPMRIVNEQPKTYSNHVIQYCSFSLHLFDEFLHKIEGKSILLYCIRTQRVTWKGRTRTVTTPREEREFTVLCLFVNNRQFPPLFRKKKQPPKTTNIHVVDRLQFDICLRWAPCPKTKKLYQGRIRPGQTKD